ncbi:GumC family protein [Rhodoligotrophos ferricapiens]|uniref:GumC family protein n=1 Tax=Rhodoligotrophos ferricapiens TaxID=3069264 RepID=UPI00315D629C
MHVVGLRETISLVRRRKYFIAIFVAASLAILAIALASTSNRYTATAGLVLERKEAPMLEAVTELQSEERDRSAVETQMDIISSRVLAGRVVDALNLVDHPWFNTYLPVDPESLGLLQVIRQKLSQAAAAIGLDLWNEPKKLPPVSVQRDQAITNFLAKLSVTRSGESFAVFVHVSTPDPELSAALANTVAKVYVTWLQDIKRQAMSDAVTFLRDRAGQIAARIADNERKIADFSRLNDLASEARDDVLRQQIDGTNQQLTTARGELAAIQARREQARLLLDRADEVEGATLTSPLLTTLRGDLARIIRERAQYASNLGANHPQVLKADAELTSLSKMIDGEIHRILEDLAGEERIAADRVRQLETQIGDLKGQLRDRGLAEIRLRELERDLLADQKLHDLIVARLGGLDPYAEITRPSAQVVSVAAVPTQPAFPQKSRIMLGGLIGAALLAVILAVGLEAVDTRIRSAQRIAQVVQLPNLASIPRLKQPWFRREHRDPLTHLAEAKRSSYTEALRSLYLASAIRLPMARPALLFTSPLDSEGTAEVAAGFAWAAANDRVRTVLVDLDPRSGLSDGSADANWPGLASVLTGQCTLADSLRPLSGIPGLDVLHGGFDHDRTPIDFLSSQNMRWLVEELRASHEMIVICCAPVLILEDADGLAPFVDGVLLVARFGRTSEQELASAANRLRINHAPLIGAALSDVDPHGQPDQQALSAANYPRRAKAYLGR